MSVTQFQVIDDRRLQVLMNKGFDVLITCCTPCPGQTSRGVIHDGLRVSHAASRPSLPRCGSTAFATSSPIDPAASGSSRLASSANHGTVFTSLSLPWVNAETFQLHGQPLLRRCGSPFCYGLSGSVRCSSVALFLLLRCNCWSYCSPSADELGPSHVVGKLPIAFTVPASYRHELHFVSHAEGFLHWLHEGKEELTVRTVLGSTSFQAPAAALRSR